MAKADPHKYHKKVQKYLDLYGTVDEVIRSLTELSDGLIDARVEDSGYDYPQCHVVGWAPMTEKEIEDTKKQQKRKREEQKFLQQKIEESEREQLIKLLEKYGPPE